MGKQRKTYLRNLLMKRFDWIEERSLELARLNGYGHVTPAMSRMFGHMSGVPVGLSELARKLGVSRQAVHKLAGEAAKAGLVEFVSSPDNARIVLLRFTQAGWVMSANAASVFDSIELELKEHIGARNLAELKRILELPWDEAEVEKLHGQQQE
ncbi:MAG: MarR family transcriptional regulator [Alcaligenaceae bacterium]|nr:MarR family transcriptional regulator [Alcaligenaceae bacterium]